MRANYTGIFLSVAIAAGCGTPTPAPSTPRCIPGATNACLCVGGVSGVQVCGSDGAYGTCMCGAPPPDASPSPDAATDGAVPREDVTTTPDATADVASPMDATATDGPAPLDAVMMNDSPPVDTTPVDVPPADAGSCSALPMTTVAPIPVGVGMMAHAYFASSPIAFTPAGLLAVGGYHEMVSRLLTIYARDGFTRNFGGDLGALSDLHFPTETEAAIVRSSRNSAAIVNDRGGGPGLMSTGVAVGIDSAGGVYYGNGAQLFRTTVGRLSPGDLVTTGIGFLYALVVNADSSALFYLTAGTGAGIYRVALSRDATGTILGSPPSLYLAASAIGAPSGLAIDVCNNLYTADVTARLLWRIPTGSRPEAPGRPFAIASGMVGQPVFGVGPDYDPTSIYFTSTVRTGPGVGQVDGRFYRVPAGVRGVRQ